MARRAMELKVVALDRVYGPVPMEKLVQLATEGRISPHDLVRAPGTQAWQTVTEVPALAASLPQSAMAMAAGQDAAEMDVDAGAGWTLRKGEKEPEDAEMDMAPMIDVTFLLLIFFMLTNSLANPSPMDVPVAVHGRGVTLEGQQLLLVDQEGGYYLGDQVDDENRAESLDALIAEVKANAQASDSEMDVIVNAHKKSNYLQIRELVEGLGEIDGLGNVMLGVEEELQ